MELTKDEFIERLIDLLDTVEDSSQDTFDEGEIEDLITEARIPITRSINLERAEQRIF